MSGGPYNYSYIFKYIIIGRLRCTTSLCAALLVVTSCMCVRMFADSKLEFPQVIWGSGSLVFFTNSLKGNVSEAYLMLLCSRNDLLERLIWSLESFLVWDLTLM